MIKLNLQSKNLEVVFHKTHEIVNLINPEKCDLIITMNITRSLIPAVATKETEVYFASVSSPFNKFVKSAIPIGSIHMKIYRTPTRVIFSSANLSLSSWNEISIILERSNELDAFINEVKNSLTVKSDFLKKFW